MNKIPLRHAALDATTALAANKVLFALGEHHGAANGIGVRALALKAMVSERAVRSAVTELRMQGIALAGHPETGYFIANSADELEPTLDFIRSRAMTSLQLEARLRNIALPDLIGQLRLKT